jgi:hypothetical protein
MLAVPSLRVPVPSFVLPALNVTVPVVVPPTPFGVLPVISQQASAVVAVEAVRVIGLPRVEGSSDEVKTVLVAPLATTRLTAFDVLPAKLASPPYTAITDSVPAGNAAV